MPLDYRQVKDIYDTLHESGAVTGTLPEWSDEMNRLTGTDLYGAGLHDNIVKRASVGIDRLLESTGLPQLSGEFGRSVGGLVGDEEAGARVGAGLPRMMTNFLPLLASAFTPAPYVVAAGRVGLGLSSLLSGAETYTSTGSPAAGVLSGATVAALPGITGAAERATLGALGARRVAGPLADVAGNVIGEVPETFFPTTGQKILSALAGQATAAGTFATSGAGQELIAGGDVHSPFTVENLLSLTLGQAPFAIAHLGGRALRGKVEGPSADVLQHAVDQSKNLIDLKNAKERLDKQGNIENLPDVNAGRETLPEAATLLSNLRAQQVATKDNPDLSDEDKVIAQQQLAWDEWNILQHHTPAGSTVLGDSVDVSKQTTMIGTQLFETPKWRVVYVTDDPSNPPELRDKVVKYSRGTKEQAPTDAGNGLRSFGVPDEQWRDVVTKEEWDKGRPRRVVDPNQPDLPPVTEPMSDEQLHAKMAELAKVATDVDLAQTSGDLQSAVVKLQSVQHEHGLPVTDDTTLKTTVNALDKSGLIEPNEAIKVAVKREAAKTSRRMQERNVPPLSEKEAARVSALMGEGGFSVVTADTLSHKEPSIESLPVVDRVGDVALRAITVQSRDIFNQWEGKADTTFGKDMQDFVDLADRFGMLHNLDFEVAAKFLNERYGTSGWDAKEVKDFVNRPHVQEWQRNLDGILLNMQDVNAAPASPTLPAGANWLFSAGTYDPETNILNGKHRLPKSGEVAVTSFRNMAGVGKPLAKAEVELYQSLVPEAFEDGKVNVPKLVEGLKEKGPVVEVRKLGAGEKPQPTSVQEQARQYQHELETAGYHIEDDDYAIYLHSETETSIDSEKLPPHLKTAIEFLREHADELRDDWEQTNNVPGATRWGAIAPKPESEMPGYVEGLVRVPVKLGKGAKPSESDRVVYDAEGNPVAEGQQGFREASGKLYRGPHFGAEDTNVLAFYRGYEETLPDGSKAFHVIEVQSDWGQARRTEKADNERYGEPIGTVGGGPVRKIADHRLLRVYESLALKAAIAHAKEVGATKVIVSDASTAGMTEGHDRIIQQVRDAVQGSNDYVELTYDPHPANRGAISLRELQGRQLDSLNNQFRSLGGGVEFGIVDDKIVIKKEPFVKGMETHYDQTLPSAMDKLTGVKGEWVELGQHKNSGGVRVIDTATGDVRSEQLNQAEAERTYSTELAQGRVSIEPPKGSPVFRDSSGNPKTQITGRLYDISHLPDAFTLTDPNRAPEKVFLPESPEDVATVKQLGTDGHSVIDFLKSSSNEFIKATGLDLSKFTDSLNRVDVKVGYTRGGGAAAYDLGNGRTQIVIPPAALSNRALLDFSVAHELVHALTISELNNPTKPQMLQDFELMRGRLAKNLRPEMRDALESAISTGWYNQWAQGKVGFNTLFKAGTEYERAVIYSLLRTKEMVAQGLSSKQFQRYMKSVKSEGQNWFSRFANTIKYHLGLGEKFAGTAFEEFLSKTDQLLEHGNFVSSFQEFSDRYFENLGLSPGQVDNQSRRALGLLLEPVGTPSDMLRSLGDTSRVSGRDFIRMAQEKSEDFQAHSMVMDEQGYASDLRGLDDFVHESVTGDNPTASDAIDLLPKVSQEYVFAKAKDLQQVLSALKAATEERNHGLLNLADPIALRGPVTKALKMVEGVLESQREWQESEQIATRLLSVAPDAFVSAPLDPELAPVASAFSRESLKEPKKGLGWFLNPVAQLARSRPETAELINAGFQLEPNARQFFGQIVKVLGIDLDSGQLSKESLKNSVKTIQSPRTQHAVDRWMAENNIRALKEKRGVTLLPASDPEIAKLLTGLSSAERAGVIDTISRTGAMTRVAQNSALNYMARIAGTRAGVIAMRDQSTMKAAQATQVAETTLRAVLADRTDPQAAQVADAQLQSIQQKLTPEGFLDLLKFTQAEAGKFSAWKEYFAANPDWATAQRQEKYLVSFNRGGKKYQLQASSTKEAQEIAKGGTGLVIEDNLKGRNDEFPVLGPDAPALMSRLQELEENQLKILSSRLTPDQLDAIKASSPVLQFGREAAATGGGIPNFRTPPRLLSQGAEELPWLWNHISWAQRQSNYWTRQLFRAQADLLLQDPEILSAPDIQKTLKQHVDNMLQPDPQLVQKVNRFTSTWFMGFAPASAMVNGMQTLSTLVPELTNITGKPLHSYGAWKSAIGEVARSTGGRWKDFEINQLMTNAERAGEIDYSMWDENAQTHEQIAMGFKQAMMKNKPQNLAQRLQTAAGSWSTAAMWLFKTVEKFNHRVTLVAAYRTGREMGLSPDEAQQQAFEVNRSVNYGGGRAGRPIGLYSGGDQFSRGAAMLATNMQNYNLGVVSQLGRYLQAGYFRPGELKPSEVFAARKAATQMLGTQLAAAGLLGLPFVSGAVALLNQMFPNLEINKNLRESVASFFSSDKDNGSILGDAAMTGLPSMLGWDMQSRLSMGNITPGVSEYNGFQPELLLGPPANLVSNFVSGALKVTQGEPVGAEAFIPPGIKKLAQYLGTGGTLKDYRERPLFNPTPGEVAGIALGFQPKRLSDFNAASRMQKQVEDVSRRRESQWNQKQAEAVVSGNFGTVRQELLSRLKSDATFQPAQAVRAIAQGAEDLTFPRDLRNEGTARTTAERSQLLQTFNLPAAGSVSELDRLRFRQEIERRLGVPPSGNQSEVAVATVMDQLRRAQPSATRSQLRRSAELALRGRRATSSFELPDQRLNP